MNLNNPHRTNRFRTFWTLLIPILTLTSARASVQFFDNSSGLPLVRFIDQTKKTLDIETYQMNDPDVDLAVRRALGRGIKVRIIQEPQTVGNACRIYEPTYASDDANCRRTKDLIQAVRAAGGEHVPFNKEMCGLANSRCYQHGKMMIFDRAMVILSTGNFNSSSLCNLAQNPQTCNRDYTVQSGDSRTVQTLLAVFENDIRGKRYPVDEVLRHPNASQDLSVSPHSLAPIVQFIGSAKKKLIIQNQYLNDPTMNQAIIDAANRGVKVFLNVSSACSFARPSENDRRRWTTNYGRFDAAGIVTRIFTRAIPIQGRPGYLHSKAIYVDDQRAWIGSVNGSTQSLTNNREFGVFTSNRQLVKSLYEFLVHDLNHPQGESWQDSLECKNDPLPRFQPTEPEWDAKQNETKQLTGLFFANPAH